MFEIVAYTKGSGLMHHAALLQCVLTGKAEDSYCLTESESCISGSAVLKVYKIAPKAHLQLFRNV